MMKITLTQSCSRRYNNTLTKTKAFTVYQRHNGGGGKDYTILSDELWEIHPPLLPHHHFECASWKSRCGCNGKLLRTQGLSEVSRHEKKK